AERVADLDREGQDRARLQAEVRLEGQQGAERGQVRTRQGGGEEALEAVGGDREDDVGEGDLGLAREGGVARDEVADAAGQALAFVGRQRGDEAYRVDAVWYPVDADTWTVVMQTLD